ncbi:hypothetical protein [Enterococcus sp. HY326]|uniref:hypothetical protein n=1 Tax=Enterococcus sp. HY326 TaxID=2971265 RepID=UPI002240B7BA|nr:hypothetical protein [Enterococcus sp. HY326]
MVIGNLFTVKIYHPRKRSDNLVLRKITVSSSETILQEVTQKDVQRLIKVLNQADGQLRLYRWKLKEGDNFSLFIYLEDDPTLNLGEFKPQMYEFFYQLFYSHAKKMLQKQQKSVKKANSLNQKLQQEKQQLHTDKKILDSENRQLIFDKALLDTELDELNKQKITLTQENLQLKDASQEMLATGNSSLSGNSAVDKELQQLQLMTAQLEEEKRRLQTKDQQLTLLEVALSEKERSLHGKRPDAKENLASLSKEQAELASAETSALRNEKQELLAELALLKADQMQLQEKSQQVATAQEQLIIRKEALQAENRQLKIHQHQTELKHQQLQKENRQFDIQVHNLTVQVEKLEAVNTQLELKIRELTVENHQLKTSADLPEFNFADIIDTEGTMMQTAAPAERFAWDPQIMAEDQEKIDCVKEIKHLKNKFEIAKNTHNRSKKKIRSRILKDGISKIGYCKYFWDVIDLKQCTTLDSGTFELLDSWIAAIPALVTDIEENAGTAGLESGGYRRISKRNLAFLDGYRAFYHFLNGFYKL